MITSYFQVKKKTSSAETCVAKKRGRDNVDENDDGTAAAASSSPRGDQHCSSNSKKRSKAENSYGEATKQLLSSLTEESWRAELQDVFVKPSFAKLAAFVATEQAKQTIYPPPCDIFASLNLCPLDQVKVVIVGQDPYHGPGQAHGLCFSVKPGHAVPPSLRNIYKELQTDMGIMEQRPQHGHLVRWARQGVLLLNTVWTVRQGAAHSHKNKGWEGLTVRVLQALRRRRCVFLLWGKPATSLVQKHLPTQTHHVRICSSHPSPLGATKTDSPFIGSRCFSRCNAALAKMGYEPIDWNVDGPPIISSCEENDEAIQQLNR